MVVGIPVLFYQCIGTSGQKIASKTKTKGTEYFDRYLGLNKIIRKNSLTTALQES